METITKDTESNEEILIPKEDAGENSANHDMVIFVLGGPGSGKGTQCSKIVSHFGFCHLSAGELLQAEIESGSEYGAMIREFKSEGKLVPTDLIIRLLQKAMWGSKNKKFLVDGFPRNEENRAAAENIMKIEPDLVLYFDCPEGELMRRILNRNEGRIDDNIETIQKRLKVYFDFTLPVINYYCLKGKVRKIDANKPVDEVFEEVKTVISKLKGRHNKS